MGFHRVVLPVSSAERLTEIEKNGLELIVVSSLEMAVISYSETPNPSTM